MFRFLQPKAGRIAVGVSLAAVVLTVFVATGFGNDNTQRRIIHSATIGRFGHIHVTTAATTPGIKLVYVRGTGTVQPGQFFGGSLKCPRRFPHPIAGLFDTNSDNTYLSSNRPEPIDASARTARKWFIGVTNAGGQPANVLAGVVCAH